MAVRYRSDFKNLNGTYFRIDIHDVDYVGATINEFTVGADGFVLTYDGDTDNRMQHIIPSEVEIPMLVASSAEETLLTQLAEGREGRHLVQIQFSTNNGSTFSDYWFGVLFADQIEITDLAYPYEVQLTATDDLKALDALEYKSTPSAAYTGSQNVASHLRNCLSKLRYYDLMSTNIVSWDEWYTCNQVDVASPSMPEDVFINHWKLWTNDDGTIKYRSTYDILEQILALFGLRMAQQLGIFMTQSIMSAEDGGTASDIVIVTKSSVTGPISGSRVRHTEGTTLKRLNGWTKSYLNPLAKVERRYKFADLTFVGYLQFYNSLSALLTGASTTMATYADDVFESGDQLSMTLQLRLKHTADGSLTGDARACRVLLKCTVKLGQYYLKREATFSATTYEVAVSGGTAEVPAFGYGAASWTTNSADRVEFVTEPLVMNVVEDLVFDFGITSPGLSADLTSSDLDVAFDAVQIDSTGTEVSTYDSQFQTEQVRNVRAIPAGTADIEGDTAIYASTNSTANDAREVYEFPETILGDNLGDVSGPLACNSTTGTVAVENWTGYTGETGEIHALLCTDYLAGQADNVPVQRGTLQEIISPTTQPQLTMMNLLSIDSVDYALFNLTYRANAAEYEVEVFKLLRDTGDITEVTPVRGDTGGGLPFNDVISVISQEKFGNNVNDIAISVPSDAVTSVNGVNPTGGAVDIDSDDIDYTGTGGGSITSAIGANTSNINTLKSYVVSSTDKAELKKDANNKIEIDGTSAAEKVTITVAGVDALEIDDVSASFSGVTKASGLEATSNADSLVLKSPNGTRWRVTVDNLGILTTTSL